MEEIFDILGCLVVIVGLIASAIGGLVNAVKKGQQTGAAQTRQTASQRRPQVRQPQGGQASAPKTVLPPREETAHRVLQPSLHDHSGMFAGSMNADDGTEGSDPHDHGFDHEVDVPSSHSAEEINRSLRGTEAPSVPAPRLALSFSPQNIASAFVLQEVLRRPGQR